MVLVYVNDIFCILKDTLVVIDAMEIIYVMKEGSMGPPDSYLEENTEKTHTQDSKVMWATHIGDYFKTAIENMEKTLKADGKILSQYRDGSRPYMSNFHPEIETSAELNKMVSMSTTITLMGCIG